MIVTIFRDKWAKALAVHELSVDELAVRMESPGTYVSKDAYPLINLARFGEHRSDKGSLRHDGNVIEVSGVEADYDAGEVGLADAQMLLYESNISAVLYTSARHTSDVPRWRVLCPLSKPYPPVERERFVARLNGVLGGILGPESFALSQAYYVGRVNGVQYESVQVRGKCIDLLDELDEKAIRPEKTGGEARAERQEKIRSNNRVIARLIERGLVLRHRSDGGVDIACLFEVEHTTPRAPGDCTYWPAHTGGFARGHCKCLHSHCANRTDADFLKALGLEQSREDPHEKPQGWPKPLDMVELGKTDPVPPRHIVNAYLPEGEVTLFAGHGGVGKSYVALDLAVCLALGKRWYGLPVEQRRVVYLALEDGRSVLHWRLGRICARHGAAIGELAGGLDLIDASHTEAEMVVENRDGPVLTGAYEWMGEHMREATVPIIDGASDAYGVREIMRRHVRYFVRALRRLIPGDGACLLLAHVDKMTAKNADTSQGYSGSTAWHNSCRARWYLRGEDDGLLLELQKTNNATPGAQIRLAWDAIAGLYVADAAPVEGGMVRAIKERQEREGIVAAIKACAAAGIDVPAATTGRRTAYNVLSIRPEFPPSLRTSGGGSRLFWQRIEELRHMRLIREDSIKRKNRHYLAVLVVSTEGRAECAE